MSIQDDGTENKMKRIISTLLIVFVMASMSVWANEPVLISAPEETTANEQNEPNTICTIGKISELGENYIIVETDNEEAIQFNYDENSYLIDSKTVFPLSLEDRTTDNVIVYHSAAMTKSIPPQSYAYSIIGNVEKDLGNPVYTVVEAVAKTEDGLKITTNNGLLIITVPNTAEVSPYRTKNIVTLDDITVNSKILLWYDAVTMSIPAYAYSEKVVILESYAEDTLIVNGVSITLQEDEKPYIENDVQMLPLRTVAEALGCTVTWNEADTSITVEKDDFSTVVYINEINDANFRSISRSLSGNHRAVLNGSKTYIEEGFFNQF